ncbi:MAG: 1-deoxy-D-xylulose-5-phosphate synthase [Bacteroidales bacterium]|nr:1-deoxy-D-xylulose-5-phosphate synthase [Bacteroidales bacterium]
MIGVILNSINSPEDLRRLLPRDLSELAIELRHYIIDTLSNHPGHLASSLGTVELTLALHYVFNTPDDKLIWDVGHQSYAHKIITGRKEVFPTIRTYEGISGFPRRDESPFDPFGTGHSSTSISAALGMATASKLQGNPSRQHIAVIGDGALTGGEAFEALNNAGVSKANILVIVNDNGISIDKAVGGLSRSLTRLIASHRYNELKRKAWNNLGGNEAGPRRHNRRIGFFQHLTAMAKGLLIGRNNMFESLGFRYFGPIDGHNIDDLVDMLAKLKDLKGPRVLHIVTKKGKGLKQAEVNPVTYHAPGKYDSETGVQIINEEADQPLKYQEVFGYTIVELAQRNERIVGITPAMPTGSSLCMMMEQMPDRAFDVGIAEQHAVTFAAGLAAQGMIPFCNIYSSFAQRAYDQIIHDVALQKLPVILCLDRAGLVGDDGPTHHGVFDLAYLRPIPNITICAPMDEHELRNMMYSAQLPDKGFVAIRYPRGASVNVEWKNAFEEITFGQGRQIRDGEEVAILSLGHIGNNAIAAVEKVEEATGKKIGHYDMRFLKPLDAALLDEVAQRYKHVVTIEDGVVKGGLGSAVVEYYNEKGVSLDIRVLGIPDHFIRHGSIFQLQKDCGIDAESIFKVVVGMLQNK